MTAERALPTVLVTGATGQVGHELVRELASFAHVVAPPRAALDLGDAASIRAAVRAAAPRVILNAGAFTAVDAAERDAGDDGLPSRVNAIAPGVLGEEAARVGARVVHFSTDYVFDGAANVPYAEDAPTNPLQAYGRTKLEGERRLAASGADWAVLRTAWVYGARGTNFLRTMLRLARERDELRVVDDQRGAPTSSRQLASAAAELTRAALRGGPWTGGIFHVSAAGDTTWHGFARELLDGALRRGLLDRVPTVTPVSTRDFGAPAVRPAYSLLDNARVETAYGVRLPDWREQLALVLDELPR